MTNPKTTYAGYAMLLSALAYLGAHFLAGTLSMMDVQAVFAALGGVGLIAAKNGGH